MLFYIGEKNFVEKSISTFLEFQRKIVASENLSEAESQNRKQGKYNLCENSKKENISFSGALFSHL